jgi:hypothetical protein
MSGEATHIYQNLLDKLTQALLTRDRAAWVEGIAIPHQLTTADGKLVHETVREVEIGFADYVGALARLGVTRMHRSCDIAQETEPGRITGFHTTEMFRSGGEALPTYSVGWTLLKGREGNWKVAKADSALSADQWQDIPYNDLTQFQREDTDSELRLRRVIQQHFNRIDLTFLHGDFEEWCRAYKLPLIIETRLGQTLIDTKEKLRADFDLYRHEFSIHRVTDVTRVIRTAELIGDTLMMATYRAHVLSGAHYVVPPWNGAVTMRQEENRWYITKILNALGHANWHQDARDPHETIAAESAPEATVAALKPRH